MEGGKAYVWAILGVLPPLVDFLTIRLADQSSSHNSKRCGSSGETQTLKTRDGSQPRYELCYIRAASRSRRDLGHMPAAVGVGCIQVSGARASGAVESLELSTGSNQRDAWTLGWHGRALRRTSPVSSPSPAGIGVQDDRKGAHFLTRMTRMTLTDPTNLTRRSPFAYTLELPLPDFYAAAADTGHS